MASVKSRTAAQVHVVSSLAGADALLSMLTTGSFKVRLSLRAAAHDRFLSSFCLFGHPVRIEFAGNVTAYGNVTICIFLVVAM